jgi:hypothetical protein
MGFTATADYGSSVVVLSEDFLSGNIISKFQTLRLGVYW